jgi:hypothetical protein
VAGSADTGKVVAAHPSRVAQADQVAAENDVKRVHLSRFCPTTHVYVIDLDYLTKLPDESFFQEPPRG